MNSVARQIEPGGAIGALHLHVPKCLVPDCPRHVRTRGLCGSHYQRAWELVLKRVTDWRTLEAQGWALPRQSRKKIRLVEDGGQRITKPVAVMGVRAAAERTPSSISFNVPGPSRGPSLPAGARGQVRREDGPARLSRVVEGGRIVHASGAPRVTLTLAPGVYRGAVHEIRAPGQRVIRLRKECSRCGHNRCVRGEHTEHRATVDAFEAFRRAESLAAKLRLPLWIIGLPGHAPPPESVQARPAPSRRQGGHLMDEGDGE